MHFVSNQTVKTKSLNLRRKTNPLEFLLDFLGESVEIGRASRSERSFRHSDDDDETELLLLRLLENNDNRIREEEESERASAQSKCRKSLKLDPNAA